MNSPAYFEIHADDPTRAVTFYSEIFGWTCTRDEQMTIEFWRIQTDAMTGAILKRPATVPGSGQGVNAFVCSMMVDDFDATAARIQKQGGKVALEKFAIPGKCWQGYFIDTEGNTFGLFQVDEHAA